MIVRYIDDIIISIINIVSILEIWSLGMLGLKVIRTLEEKNNLVSELILLYRQQIAPLELTTSVRVNIIKFTGS